MFCLLEIPEGWGVLTKETFHWGGGGGYILEQLGNFAVLAFR